MMKVCQAFSLLSVSSAVGMRAKHSVITSKASQHTCSSSPSGSFAAFVYKEKERFYYTYLLTKASSLLSYHFNILLEVKTENKKAFYLLVYLADFFI